MEKVKVKALSWGGGKDPTFKVGEIHTATATLANQTGQPLTITAELFMDVTKVATSGRSSAFTLAAGASQTVNFQVVMPAAGGGPYHAYLGVWSGTTLLTLYQATDDVTIQYPPIAIATTTLPGGYVGLSYSQTLQATGGSGSYSWSIASGSLPPGLSLSGGIISGTPATAGTYTFTVQVTDGATTATQSLTITISQAITVGPITWA
jgi:hypothetical protein